jgi:CHAT domain-containing protein
VGVLVSLAATPGSGAVPTVEECVRRIEREPRSFEHYRCLTMYGGAERRAQALTVLEMLRRRRPHDGRPVFISAFTRALAGQPVEEREFEEAAEKFAAEGEVAGQVYALTTLMGDRCFGRALCDQRSEDILRRAEALAEPSGDVSLRRLVRVWRFRKALIEDDLDAAERAEAELNAVHGPDPPWLATQFLLTRAHLRGLLGNYEAGRTDYLALMDQTPPGSNFQVAARAGAAGMAAMLALRKRFDRAEAEEELRQVLREEARIELLLSGSDLGLYSTQVQLALLLGPTPEAWSLLEASLAGQTGPRSWSIPYVPLWSMARLAADGPPEHRSAGLAHADRALAITAGKDAKFEQARSNVMRSYVLFHLGRFDEARAAGQVGLDLAEGLRQKQADVQSRMRYEETLAVLYQVLASALLEFGGAEPDRTTVEASFQTMERLRARSLLESLMAPVESAGVRRPLAEPAPPTLAEVQAALTPGQALVSYQIWRREPTLNAPYLEGTSWAVVVTPGAVRAVPIRGGDELEDAVKLWLSLLERGDGSEQAASARLDARVLMPVRKVLGPEVRQLLIVPDGTLHRLPFDALRSASASPFAAEQFEMVLVPSAAAWLRLRGAGEGRAGLALALADPPVPPGVDQLRTAPGSAPLGALPLLGARREAEHAVAAFPKGSRLVIGPDASEGFLKTGDLAAYSLVHLATHAIADESAPDRSAVVLAASAGGDDGLLTVPEIAALRLRGKVVILAACESSIGPVRRGEGVLSLARAFFEAGAAAVVGTLGPVSDPDSEAFFRDFYDALGAGRNLSGALAAAKRAAIQRGAPPVAWSRFVVVGNGAVTPREGPASAWPWLLGLLGAVLLGLGIARARFSNRGVRKTEPLPRTNGSD